MNLTPAEIVRELSKHIVGQEAAKRAVAVALRNRYRRKKLPPEIAREVTPKNILMIGPTGVGKTEIARRLARLAGAPFVKVEATKFTEVGYVGRDVDSIVRDLAEASYQLVLEEMKKKVEEKALALAEEELATLLRTSVAEVRSGRLDGHFVEVQVEEEVALPFPARDLGVEDDAAAEAGHLRGQDGDQLARVEVRVLREQHRPGDGVIDPGVAATDLVGRQDLGRHADGVGLRGERRLMVERPLRPAQGEQAHVLEVEGGGQLGAVTQEELAAAQVQVAEHGRAAFDVGRGRGAPELPTPREQVRIEARTDPERALAVEHPLEAERHHTGRGERHEVTGDDHPGVAERAGIMIRGPLLQQHDGPPATQELVGGAQADDPAADDDDRSAHAGRMPQAKGSSGWNRKVASAWTKARPVTKGWTWPSGSRR